MVLRIVYSGHRRCYGEGSMIAALKCWIRRGHKWTINPPCDNYRPRRICQECRRKETGVRVAINEVRWIREK